MDAVRGGAGTIVVMPTYQEADNIGVTLPQLLACCPEVDVLVVDDNSPDGTGAKAEDMAKRDPRVHVIHRHDRRGLGPAYVQGFRWSLGHGYDLICEMDMDGSHRPQDLARMLAVARGKAHPGLVIGSRRVRGGRTQHWPWYRDLISRLGSWYARTALGSSVRDMTAGLRVYRADVLRRIDLRRVRSSGYVFQVDMLRRVQAMGLSVVEVPIVFVERVRGSSKMDAGIVLEAMVQVTLWGLERLTHRN